MSRSSVKWGYQCVHRSSSDAFFRSVDRGRVVGVERLGLKLGLEFGDTKIAVLDNDSTVSHGNGSRRRDSILRLYDGVSSRISSFQHSLARN